MNRTKDRIIPPAGIRYVIGTADILAGMGEQQMLKPFSGETLDFLDHWSGRIRAEIRKSGKNLSDAAAFAFWCRRTNTERMRETYGAEPDDRIGTGVTLHYAASNVPVLFAFSAAAALLAGDPVILRLPSKESPQGKLICEALSDTMEEFYEWRGRMVFLRFDREEEINRTLAGLCRVRIIWGGDETVREIRRFPLPVRAQEITFPDRSSAAIIDAAAVLREPELQPVARAFYNDTYLNDQNACSSPRIVYWLGEEEEVAAARERFWQSVADYAGPRYDLSAVIAIKKLEQAYYLAVVREDAKITFYGGQENRKSGVDSEEQERWEPDAVREKPLAANCRKQSASDFGKQPEDVFEKQPGVCEGIKKGNTVVSVWLDRLDASCLEYAVPGGFFLESGGKTPDGFYPVLTEKCQTLTCFGIDTEALRRDFLAHQMSGVDRIVPFGHALDFSLFWDGRDLIREMSRRISLE